MHRIYADGSGLADYRAREDLALDVEAHLFAYLKGRFKPEQIVFSDEQGRRNKNKTRAPNWGVFVYLVVKVLE